MRFAGKVALVTGAGSGIGAATARKFAAEGARLALCDRNGDAVEQVAAELRARGADAWARTVDVSVATEVDGFVAATVARFGRLDCAVNNAGISPAIKALADYDEPEFDLLMAVDLKSVWLCMRAEIPRMLPSGGGAIVNVASTAGIAGVPYFGTYVAAKHGVVGLTRAGALDYAKQGIRINAICPGFTRTPLAVETIAAIPGLTEDIAAAGQPIGRMALAEEQADAILYLCSAEASYVLGQALVVDGGMTVA